MRKQPFPRQSEEKRDFVLKIAIVDGLSSVWVQYLALPCFGVLFKLIVDAEIGMILFLYLFIIDYLLVVRAAAFCICQALFGYNFFSCQTGCSSSENTCELRKGGERHATVTRLPFPFSQRSPLSDFRRAI